MTSKFKNFKITPDYTEVKKSLVITQVKKGDDIGIIRHFPAATNYWFNSVYFFDKNKTNYLLYSDTIVNKLIKMYFNLIPSTNKNIKFITRRSRTRVSSLNQIFTSRAEIKHYNDKVIITIYTYNRIKKYYLKKLLDIRKKIFIVNNNIANKIFHVLYKKFKFFKKEYNFLLKKLSFFSKNNLIFIKSHIKNNLSLTIKFNFLNNLKKLNKQYYKTFIRNILKKELLYLNYNKLLIADSYKYNNTYLCRLNKLLSIIYKKKVEFNIVNLKYEYLDINIYLNIINILMRKRSNSNSLIFGKASSLPDTTKSKIYEYNTQNRYIKNYNKLNLNYANFKYNQYNDILNFILNKIYEINNNNNEYKYKSIFRSIKLKEFIGIRFKAKGRITKRLTASRSVSKIGYKGSIKNIDSSMKGLSTVLLKNNLRSNINYTCINSKTRNGSFGLRGWLGSK